MTGGMVKSFLSTLNILDREFSPELVEKYGNDMYLFALDMFGKKSKVENNSFYHYETRKKGRAIQVASKTGGASAGVIAVLTIAAGSHYDSGTKSPIRVGDVIQVSASGVMGKVTAKSTTTPSAHTVDVYPLKSTDTFGPANNDWCYVHGLLHTGEASSKHEGVNPIVDRITNTVTEVREDYQISDKAAMEKIEWKDPSTGQQYYKYFGTKSAEKAFLQSREKLLVFSEQVNVAALTANGTVGSKGMIPQIVAGGSDLSYTAGSAAVTDFQAIGRQLTFNGAAPEIHFLSDIYQYQEFQRLLFTTFDDGAILWDSVGGSAEAAAKYGFKSFAIDGYQYHFKKYAPFSPEWEYGVSPATASAYKNYGIAIPQGFASQPDGGKLLTIGLVYQEILPGVEVMAWESGAMANGGKGTNDKLELWNHFAANYGVRVAAANQCVILNG
jgi:hypothetical protein